MKIQATPSQGRVDITRPRFLLTVAGDPWRGEQLSGEITEDPLTSSNIHGFALQHEEKLTKKRLLPLYDGRTPEAEEDETG